MATEFYEKLPNQLPNGDKVVDFVALAQSRLPDIHDFSTGDTGHIDIIVDRSQHGIKTLNRVTVRFFDPAKSPHQKLSDAEMKSRNWQLVGCYRVPTVDGNRRVKLVQAQEAAKAAIAANANKTDAPVVPPIGAPNPATVAKARKGAPKGGWPKKGAKANAPAPQVSADSTSNE